MDRRNFLKTLFAGIAAERVVEAQWASVNTPVGGVTNSPYMKGVWTPFGDVFWGRDGTAKQQAKGLVQANNDFSALRFKPDFFNPAEMISIYDKLKKYEKSTTVNLTKETIEITGIPKDKLSEISKAMIGAASKQLSESNRFGSFDFTQPETQQGNSGYPVQLNQQSPYPQGGYVERTRRPAGDQRFDPSDHCGDDPYCDPRSRPNQRFDPSNHCGDDPYCDPRGRPNRRFNPRNHGRQ